MIKRQRWNPRSLATVVSLLGALVIAGGGTAQASAAPTCTPHDVSFSTLLVSGTMHGTLCRPQNGSSTVMVLVPGATYQSIYWDFPYQPDVYNFRQAMNEGGYATFVVDRIGTGQSSRPLGLLTSTDVQAAALHRVIGRLRSGALGGTAYESVILGGHSLGSAITITESVIYHDVDAVLLTGVTHTLNVTNAAPFVAGMVPAGLDPVTAAQGYTVLDPGYLTTGTAAARAHWFHAARVDPNVVALDEATKSVFSAGELPLAFPALLTPESLLIDVPVLLAVGGGDLLFCVDARCSGDEPLRQAEAPNFSSQAQLRTHVLPGAGHDLNLDPMAPQYQQAVLDWADEFVGH